MVLFKQKAYCLFVFALGVGTFCLLGDYREILQVNIYSFLTFAAISLMAEYLPVKLPITGHVTVNFAIDFAVILIFGPTVAATVAVSTYLIFEMINFRKVKNVFMPLFDAGQFTVTILISGHIFMLLGGVPGQIEHNIFIPALATIFFYLVLNLLFFILYSSITSNISILRTWLTGLKWTMPNYLALGALGYIIAVIYSYLHSFGVIILFIPLVLARHSFKLYMDMRDVYLETIMNLASIIDAKDHYTAGHSKRVAQYVVAICEEMNLPDKYIEDFKDIALLHDIGKIAIPEHILNKPGRLDDWEMEKMKTHPTVGYEIIKQITFLKHHKICKYHHERLDGKGYPEGLKGDEIPLGARIIAVADSFDAMTSDRPYRKGMDVGNAFRELERCKGTQFDPAAVDAFIRGYPKLTQKLQMDPAAKPACDQKIMEE
ncbi:HD-GYP domain-containing protein [Candidatus Formimonas warabiya]|uniref:HD-GYP domain-containing protein n=1 Tax=Formimonas warabiya TaxID=1761012 RepID=A0A3G1KTV1_FORW1|nr:HD-GYP domain-containing protein [Candidatus Formimonas warabiya]ATW25933.1 hypothetical protein DCMF_15155 [Candidatus Formimonas warabiya]